MTSLAEHEVRSSNDSGYADAVLRWRARDILRKSQLEQHLPRSGVLLDLGSGQGHVAEAIVRHAPGRSCVMMDPVASTSRRVARRIAARRCHAIKGSGLHLPFADRTFDGVWAAFVLHHVRFDGQQAILAEIRRVLRPGAPFVLLEDTPSNPGEVETTLLADRRLNSEPDEAPHHYRSPDEWRNDLPQLGFEVTREVAFKRLFPPATLGAVHHRAFVCGRR